MILEIHDDSNRDRSLQPNHHGGVAKTLNSIRSDADHVPCVLIIEDEDTDREKVF